MLITGPVGEDLGHGLYFGVIWNRQHVEPSQPVVGTYSERHACNACRKICATLTDKLLKEGNAGEWSHVGIAQVFVGGGLQAFHYL